jgi:transcriptional regulator with XRE-family HTH domain
LDSARETAMVPRHPVDVHVGNRVRLRRIQLNVSREEVADLLRISPELMHRHESGQTPMSVSCLCEVAKTLGVAPEYFFEDMEAVVRAWTGQA